MNTNIYKRGCRLFCTVIVALAAIFVGGVRAQEKTGTVQQGLVGGTLVSTDVQEKYGLVSLSTGCSGSLIRNNWVITAAHCVDKPDPVRPGNFITIAEDSVTIGASWKGGQVRQSARIITFRPNDVAIIRFNDPFNEETPSQGYNRQVYQPDPAPFFVLKVLNLTAFGRGINQFAQGSGATAMPAVQDKKYRMAYFNTVQAGGGETPRVWYPSASGPMIAGGDSGGPSYIKGPSGDLLFGVHSLCEATCLPGKNCDNNNWNWVTSTPRCADAPIAPVWDEINRYLGAFVPNPPPAVKAIGRVKIPGGTGAPPISICEAARQARARNSPAAPGLEAQCRAAGAAGEIPAFDLDALAARGETLAKADPLLTRLRIQQPDDANRRGLYIGLAAAEGQTAPGPGKQRIHDSLSPTEQSGYDTAVTFSLERNRNAKFAAIGAAISQADEVVAQARKAEADVFYRLGFDIATGIFGDPALGAQGNTATGPGSLGIRDALSPAGQRGFNAAVKLHLSRNYRR